MTNRKEMDQEFIQCSFAQFMKAYLPFVPEKKAVKACLRRLHESGILGICNAGTEQEENLCEGFVDFHKPGKVTEGKLFSFNLDGIAEVITTSRISGRKNRYKFYDCHNREIASDVFESANKIDACFLPVEFRVPQPGQTKAIGEGDQFNTADIPVACTWKPSKSPASRQQNNLQIVSANVQIMNFDVRRMFSFGMTIEADELRLWYFGRSHSAVSEIVNFVREPAWLVKAFMSFTFATKEEMGYDPNVTRHDGRTFTYRIPAAGGARFFRTKKVISEYRSNNVTGRMARVWLVDEVKSSAKNAIVKEYDRVLKDVWLEDSARTEKQIQNAIFEDIEKFWSSPTPASEPMLQPIKDRHAHLFDKSKNYKNFFMKIVVDYQGEKTKPLASGSEKLRDLFSLVSTPSVSSKATGDTPRETAGANRSIDPQEDLAECDSVYSLRKQYRVVFEEECVPVGELERLGDVVSVLRQALIPLQLLFCAGCVHRDISSGNLLAYEQDDGSWQAKLSDLEYAKKFPPAANVKPSGDPKTGTPYFMALEILDRVYFAKADRNQPEASQGSNISAALAQSLVSQLHMPEPVRHNYQHDIESVWWLFVWTSVDRIPHKASYDFSKTIFRTSMTPSQARRKAFAVAIGADLLAHLKPSLLTLAGPIEMIRERLYDAYVAREKAGKLDDRNTYVDIHNDMYETFKFLEENATWADEKLGSRRTFEQTLQLGQNTGGGMTASISSALGRGKRPRSAAQSSSSKRQRRAK